MWRKYGRLIVVSPHPKACLFAVAGAYEASDTFPYLAAPPPVFSLYTGSPNFVCGVNTGLICVSANPKAACGFFDDNELRHLAIFGQGGEMEPNEFPVFSLYTSFKASYMA